MDMSTRSDLSHAHGLIFYFEYITATIIFVQGTADAGKFGSLAALA